MNNLKRKIIMSIKIYLKFVCKIKKIDLKTNKQKNKKFNHKINK